MYNTFILLKNKIMCILKVYRNNYHEYENLNCILVLLTAQLINNELVNYLFVLMYLSSVDLSSVQQLCNYAYLLYDFSSE